MFSFCLYFFFFGGGGGGSNLKCPTPHHNLDTARLGISGKSHASIRGVQHRSFSQYPKP